MLALDFSFAFDTVLSCFVVRSLCLTFLMLSATGCWRSEGTVRNMMDHCQWCSVSPPVSFNSQGSAVGPVSDIVNACDWVTTMTLAIRWRHIHCYTSQSRRQSDSQEHKDDAFIIIQYTCQQHSVQRRWTQQRGVRANNLKLNRTRSIEIIFTGNVRQLQGP